MSYGTTVFGMASLFFGSLSFTIVLSPGVRYRPENPVVCALLAIGCALLAIAARKDTK